MTESNPSQTREIIDNYYRFLQQRDREGLLSILCEDIRIIYHAHNSTLPWAGVYDGIAGFDAFFNSIKSHLDIVEVIIEDRIYTERKAVMQCQGRWRRKTQDIEIKGAMVNVFTIENNRIKQYEVYADTASFETAMRG